MLEKASTFKKMARTREQDLAYFAANPETEKESSSTNQPQPAKPEVGNSNEDPSYLRSKLGRRRVAATTNSGTMSMQDCFAYDTRGLPTIKQMKDALSDDELADAATEAVRRVLRSFNELNTDVILANGYTVGKDGTWNDQLLRIKDVVLQMAIPRHKTYNDNRSIEEMTSKVIWGSIAEFRAKSEFVVVASNESYDRAQMWDLLVLTEDGPKKMEVKAHDVFDCQTEWLPIDIMRNATPESFASRKVKQEFDYLSVWVFGPGLRFEPDFILSREEYDQPYNPVTKRGVYLSQYDYHKIPGLKAAVVKRSLYEDTQKATFDRCLRRFNFKRVI